MKIKELKEKTELELEALLKATREQIRSSRFKTAAKQLKNVREIRALRRTVAQILTLRSAEKIVK